MGGGAASDFIGADMLKGTASQQTFPFRRMVLIVTLAFFLILATEGTIESFQQHSIYPLLSRTVLKVVASDRLLGATAEQLATHQAPAYTGILNKSFPVYIWFIIVTFFDVVSSLYFIFFFGWLLYMGYTMISTDSPLKNAILAVVTYAVLTFMISTMLFMADNAGRTLPANGGDSIKAWALSSYPFQGVSKMVMLLVTPNTLKSIADWTENGGIVANVLTNVPQGNTSIAALTNGSVA